MIERHLVFTSFFIFGLLNNILYVIILSAAIDLVGSSAPKAIVLLADIVPSFTIKLVAPFFIHLLPYNYRIWTLVGLSSFGMILISTSSLIGFKICGITLASFSAGLGEVSFLQLTHYYKESNSISGFSSGTGGAGLLGSFIFMLLTNLVGIPVSLVLKAFAVIPFGFVLIYYGILPVPEIQYEEVELESISFKGHMSTTIDRIKPLIIPYMIPLTTVYIFEYIINQGISPTLLYPLDTLPKWLFSSYRDIYVVYGFLYQLGVFLSRSSVIFGFRFKKLYLLSILQFLNVVLCIIQSMTDWPFKSIYVLMILIFYEGLLGGLSYVNTFLSVSDNVLQSDREFSMGAVSISDGLGIVLAGFVNWWLEPKLCNHQVNNGRSWCQTG